MNVKREAVKQSVLRACGDAMLALGQCERRIEKHRLGKGDRKPGSYDHNGWIVEVQGRLRECVALLNPAEFLAPAETLKELGLDPNTEDNCDEPFPVFVVTDGQVVRNVETHREEAESRCRYVNKREGDERWCVEPRCAELA